MEKVFDLTKYVFIGVYFFDDEEQVFFEIMWAKLADGSAEEFKYQGKTLNECIMEFGNDSHIAYVSQRCGVDYALSLGFVNPDEYVYISSQDEARKILEKIKYSLFPALKDISEYSKYIEQFNNDRQIIESNLGNRAQDQSINKI